MDFFFFPFMSQWQDAPDLGAYTHVESRNDDDEVLAELEREVEELNEADADDAAQYTGGAGRGSGDDLAQAFQHYRAQRLAEIQAQYVACVLTPERPHAQAQIRVILTAGTCAK